MTGSFATTSPFNRLLLTFWTTQFGKALSSSGKITRIHEWSTGGRGQPLCRPFKRFSKPEQGTPQRAFPTLFHCGREMMRQIPGLHADRKLRNGPLAVQIS